jgi:hypothetical protein
VRWWDRANSSDIPHNKHRRDPAPVQGPGPDPRLLMTVTVESEIGDIVGTDISKGEIEMVAIGIEMWLSRREPEVERDIQQEKNRYAGLTG